TFDGSPLTTPFGGQLANAESRRIHDFALARPRLTKQIVVKDVVMDQIDFDRVDFDSVRLLLAGCDFERLFIVQYNLSYNVSDSQLKSNCASTIFTEIKMSDDYQIAHQHTISNEIKFGRSEISINRAAIDAQFTHSPSQC
ncbi:hypothetical protein PENTCL1PPCAC_23911, partial [Pristionchus entomophagus]